MDKSEGLRVLDFRLRIRPQGRSRPQPGDWQKGKNFHVLVVYQSS
ncbi:hypothetical protein [Fischerella sp. FACHB-380]|nr:hypothetical protein [Fischerella sp. FACHB-380]